MVLIWINIITVTVKDLKSVTLKEILREVEDLTGNTRFMSISALAAFFYEGLNETHASRLIGYKDQNSSMIWRANKVAEAEISNLYDAYKKLKRAGILIKSLKWLLDPTRRPKSGIWYSRNRINYSKRIVREMVIRYGRSRRRAAEETGVPLSTINFWRNY
jgi:hypothetical protein